MEKEFVPYELALKLKTLGFNRECGACYYKKFDNEIGYHKVYRDFNSVSLTTSAPTFSQAFRWFREKYHIHGEPFYKRGLTKQTSWYDYKIYSTIDWINTNPKQQWKTYEEAELACLDKLIEIVEQTERI